MKEYPFKDIETKWQKKWIDDKLYLTDISTSKEKMYVLDMFPYPSGEGLHVGHPKGYIATDIYSRMKKMQGHEVLHPMGWDAFGLPAEQFAIKNKVHPRLAVEKNIKRFKEQLAILGFNYDWSREVNTTDPSFYRWTQWIFLKLYEKGLAHESYEPINWCPTCQTGLANEDLEQGKCERCGSEVEKRPMRQWVLKITDYAERMLEDLEQLNWPEHIKESQRNWIGKSEGSEFDFKLTDIDGQVDGKHVVKIFTTRADTLYGATYVAISAALAKSWLDVGWKTSGDVQSFVKETLKEQEANDYTASKEKKGIFTGVYAINPATQEKIPVWIANYVLGDIGTGAIMAVPAHDERDFEFAKKFNLPIKGVIDPEYIRDVIPEGTHIEDKNKIVAIVENKEGSILVINWGDKLGGKLFLGGTVEVGEKPEETALRELKEETGYQGGEILAVSEETFMYTYYAFSKEKFYRAKTKFVHIRLKDDTRGAAALEENEKNKFEVMWLSKKEAEKEVVEVLHKRAFNLFVADTPYVGEGTLHNSGNFDTVSSKEARTQITEAFGGKKTTRYKLQDWVFSRQRYWGEPIPMVRDEGGKVYPLDESELPLLLPEVEHYEPAGTGESPLANITDWVNVKGYITDNGTFKKSTDGQSFKRETNTMPQWAGSSWYYLRYIDPTNENALVDKTAEEKWSPVDFYVGGAEHATRHLIYARFWHKFLYDIGVVNYQEPFKRLQNVGLILAEDGRKMSKRFGNVVNPDDIVREFGADTLRVYEMFMGPFDQSVAWSTKSMAGVERFLERVWKIQDFVGKDGADTILPLLHKTIKKVTEDIESFKFNTAISQMMILVNAIEEVKGIKESDWKMFLQLLAPFAPHMTEELWEKLGNTSSIHTASWPKFDEALTIEKEVTIALQVNGKLRDTFTVETDLGEEELKKLAQNTEGYKKYVGEVVPKKVIIIKNKLINVVI